MTNLIFKAAQKLRGSKSLDYLAQIEAAPFRSREEVLSDQWQSLSRLLAHAEARVPYYRELFKSLGIRSSDIQGWSDFSKLPILTKDIIKERWQDLIREDVPLTELSKHHSGGSTGIPLTFYRDREYMDVSEAGTFRNLEQCGWKPGQMIGFFWGGNDKLYRMSRLEFEARQQLRRMYQFDPFHSGPDELALWLKRWNGLRAVAALGYASTIARFASFIESNNKTVAPLKGVFTTAEKIYPEQREIISRVFGCKVFDCYGSSEVQNIAAECPSGRMHINADFVVLETEENGSSPFLVTSLRNYAMPFIRYRNEDAGELSDDICDCGNGFPLMKLSIGRISDNFYLPCGRVVHGEFFTHLMYGSRGIDSFQFYQSAPDRITIFVVPSSGNAAVDFTDTLRSAEQQIRDLTPAKLQIESREVTSIPLSAAGKHRFTRSDVTERDISETCGVAS
jgi:phenylacetate-CoA ligase